MEIFSAIFVKKLEVFILKKVYIERQERVLRIAVTEKDKLIECFIEEDGENVFPGQLYKAVVRNIVPAIKCAFVDIGIKKNAYMYLDERYDNLHIKKGDQLLVEVIKESIGSKGPKVTNAATVPGRYCVIKTMPKTVEISKKIEDQNFINKMKSEIKKPSDAGVMVRTNAKKVSIQEINGEIELLYNEYKKAVKECRYLGKPRLLYNPGGYIGKVIRDIIDESTEEIVVNDHNDYMNIKEVLCYMPEVKASLEMHSDNISIMQYFGIESQILKLRNNKVELECGGSIIIEKTEAMYVIDVNSGKNVRGSSIEKTAETTNLQAAKEIARQVKLRNLSGIIVVDFIDLNDANKQKKVVDTLIEGFKNDKNKTIVYPFTELSLVQLARTRRGKSVLERMEDNCSSCNGTGRKLKLSYLTYLLKNEVMRLTNKQYIYIQLNEAYKNSIMKNVSGFANAIGAESAEVYVDFVKYSSEFKVKPLIFETDREKNRNYKIYG